MRYFLYVVVALGLLSGSAEGSDHPKGSRRDPATQETGSKARPDSETLQNSTPNLRLASWSLDGIGGKVADNRDPAQIADVLSHFDIVALQGVANADAISGILPTLQAMTGVTWTFRAEPTNGKDFQNFHENTSQAVLWRTDRIKEKVPTAVVDPQTAGWMAAPYGGVYTLNGKDFVLVTITGIPKSGPPPEAVATAASLGHRLELRAPIFFCGDYASTRSAHEANVLAQYMRPLVENGNTRLKSRLRVVAGAKSGLRNNIWTTSIVPISAGVYPFHRVLGLAEDAAADTISGQLPVFALPLLDLMQGSGPS